MTWLLPGLLVSEKTVSRDEQMTPLNFPHLVERLSLLVIITFGEMIIGIAPYFTRHTLSIWTVLIFLIVANLFMTYIVEIDHLIDDEQRKRLEIAPSIFIISSSLGSALRRFPLVF